MNITYDAEIHFHQQTQVSVFLETNLSGDEEKIGEIAMASFFAIRMMSNLNVNDTSDRLAMFLQAAPEAVHQFASRSATSGFELIPYSGTEGRKSFLAYLRMEDAGTRFDVKPKGFDLLATGVGFYAPMAVIALIRQLAERRKNESSYLDALGAAASRCAQFHLNREITLTNHGHLVLSILGNTNDLLLDTKRDQPRRDSEVPVNAQAHETSSFAQLLNKTRNLVTIATIDTYPDRQSQRCAPTFVTVAGGILNDIHEQGALRTKDDFGLGDLEEFIGHLNMLHVIISLRGKLDVDELAGTLCGIGCSYHLKDEQIDDWQRAMRDCEGDDRAVGRLVAHLDRIVEPIGLIWTGDVFDVFGRLDNWATLLADINTAYYEMMENSEWIAKLDFDLDRVN